MIDYWGLLATHMHAQVCEAQRHHRAWLATYAGITNGWFDIWKRILKGMQ